MKSNLKRTLSALTAAAMMLQAVPVLAADSEETSVLEAAQNTVNETQPEPLDESASDTVVEGYAYALSYGETEDGITPWKLLLNGEEVTLNIRDGLDVNQKKTQICTLVKHEDNTYSATVLKDLDESNPPESADIITDHKMPDIYNVSEESFTSAHGTCYLTDGFTVYDITGQGATTLAPGDTVHTIIYYEDGKEHAICGFITRHTAPEDGYAYALSYGETEDGITPWTVLLNGEEVTLNVRDGLDVNQKKTQICILVKHEDETYSAIVLKDLDENNPPATPDIITDHKMPDIYNVSEESFTSAHGTCYLTEGFTVYDITGQGATELAPGDTVHTIIYYEDGREHAICGFITRHTAAVDGYAYALSHGETEDGITPWTVLLNGEEVTIDVRDGLDVNQKKTQICTLVQHEDGTYSSIVLKDLDENNPPATADIITDHKMPDIYNVSEESFTSAHGTCYLTEGFTVYDITGQGATELAPGDTVHTIIYYEDGKEHAICGFITRHTAPVDGYAYALSYGETTDGVTAWTVLLNGEEVTIDVRDGLDVNQKKTQICSLVKHEDGTYSAIVLKDLDENNPPATADIITDHKMPDIFDVTESSFSSAHGTCYLTEGFTVYDITGQGATTLAPGDTVHTIIYYEDGKEHAICGFITRHASEEQTDSVEMFRLYNPNTGQHLYTSDAVEQAYLATHGWNDEGIGWLAPKTSSTPVYRLYNPNSGDHHYTTDKNERDYLAKIGWNDEGIGWYSDDACGTAVLRQFNPNEKIGNHNFTTDTTEHTYLVSIGWNDEGIAWYGLK